MSWVMLSLRKKELKRAHADYVAQELQISREERQASRRYQYEQTCVQNDKNQETRDAKDAYKDTRTNITDKMSALRKAASEQSDASIMTNEDGTTTATKVPSIADYVDTSGMTLNDYQRELDAAKEDYESQNNDIATYWEDELQMIEEEANDFETFYEQEKVNAETQMEAISQEISSVDQAISSEIQNNTIKLS